MTKLISETISELLTKKCHDAGCRWYPPLAFVHGRQLVVIRGRKFSDRDELKDPLHQHLEPDAVQTEK